MTRPTPVPTAFASAAALTIAACGYQDREEVAGLQCGSIGDVDGDGREDLAVAMRCDPATGAAESRLLILSGPGLEPLALILWPSSERETGRAWELGSRGAAGGFSLGDLDGDGRSDFALKERFLERMNPDVGRLLVIAGGDWRVLHEAGPSAAPEPLVRALQDLGDLDGDGAPDHAEVLEPERYPGLVDDELPPTHDTRLRVRSGRTWSSLFELGTGAPWEDFGTDIARTVDCDGDGTADLVLKAPWDADQDGAPSLIDVVSGRDGSVLERSRDLRWEYDDQRGVESLSSGSLDDRPLVLVQKVEHGRYAWSHSIYRMPLLEFVETFWGRAHVVGDLDGDRVSDWVAWTRDTDDFIEAYAAFSGADRSRIWLRRLDWNDNLRPGAIPGVPNAWISMTFEFHGTGDLNGDGLRDVAVTRTPLLAQDRFDTLEERCGEVFLVHGRTGETLVHLDRAALAALEARCSRRVRL